MPLFKFILSIWFMACGLFAIGLPLPALTLADSSRQQDEPTLKPITISGKAVLPNGDPAANFLVEIVWSQKDLIEGGGGRGKEPPPELLSQDRKPRDPLLGTGVTDKDGRFSIKFDHKNAKLLEVRIGNKIKSAWMIKPVWNRFKDVDVGKIQLVEKVS
jgi:hypothetical protein